MNTTLMAMICCMFKMHVNARVLGVTSQGENKLKKVLLIPEHISGCEALGQDMDKDELVTENGRSFKLQGRSKRPDARDITTA
jgi:hypothetical protein